MVARAPFSGGIGPGNYVTPLNGANEPESYYVKIGNAAYDAIVTICKNGQVHVRVNDNNGVRPVAMPYATKSRRLDRNTNNPMWMEYNYGQTLCEGGVNSKLYLDLQNIL